jgi:predicted Zn-dependent protease
LVRLLRRVKLWGWIALSVLVGAAVAFPRLASSRFVAQRRAARDLALAESHLAAHRFAEARNELRAALRLQPDNAQARSRLASLELELGNRELAFVEFQSLTEMQPQDPDGWVGLANLMVRGGLLDAPESALDRAIAAAPKRADARSLRGDIRFRVGRYHGARIDADAALAQAPNDGATWGLLVRSTARSQGRTAAIDVAERAVAAVGQHPALVALLASLRGAATNDLGPAPVPPKRFRAEALSAGGRSAAVGREHWPGRMAQMRQMLEVHMRQQNWTEGERVVESARQAYPGTAFAPFLAGIVQIAQGNTDAAEKHLLESLRAAPRSPVVVTALAKAWSRKSGAAFAAQRLMELAERDPGLAFARHLASRAWLDARDPIAAEGALRRGLALQPDSTVPYGDLAEYFLEVDRAAEAMSILQQGLERFPQDSELQIRFAQTSADFGHAKEAIRIYEDVLSRRPDLDIVEYKLASLLASQVDRGSSPRLAQLVAHLKADEPSDPLLLDALGWAESHVGERARALSLLEAAVNAAPDEPAPHYHLAAIYARENQAERAQTELKAAVDSKRPFPERLEAMRLLRKDTDTRRTAP